MKVIIKKMLNRLGYDIHKKNAYISTGSVKKDNMYDGLARAKNRNFIPNTIIDVGAAAGTWTKKTLTLWPDADYILIEPLEERQNELMQLQNDHHHIQVVQAVLGKESGEVDFSIADDLDGSGVYEKGIENNALRKVKVVALDDLIAKNNKKGPFLIKLDTHGYELPIFEGAAKTLKQTELLIVEAYGFYVSPHAVLFYDICKYLDEIGLRPINIIDVVNRRKDGAFWQCDIFFAPKSNPVFKDNAYA